MLLGREVTKVKDGLSENHHHLSTAKLFAKPEPTGSSLASHRTGNH
jgi:hypothetical protein